MRHDWNIIATEMGRGATVIAVCRNCGSMRQVWLAATEHGGKIDLSGECLAANRTASPGTAATPPFPLQS